MSTLGDRVFNGIRLFLSKEPPKDDAEAGPAAEPGDDSSSDTTSSSAASSAGSADGTEAGTASASITPADTPRTTPALSPLFIDVAVSGGGMPALEPFPPPPSCEPHAARAGRERRELQLALLHLHAEVSAADAADGRVFLDPVDEAFAPCYFEVVSTPMDLGLIGRRIDERYYCTAWEYMTDFHTMINNCLEYNKAGTFHNKYAQKFLKMWAPKVDKMCMNTLVHHDYCCGRKRTLSGFAYRCRGGTCFIRYGCVFWSYDPKDGEDEIVYCQSHYQRLPAEVTIPRFGNDTGGDITFKKYQLGRSRHNTPLIAENFVTCVECGHRDHEICKLHQQWVSPIYHCDRCRKTFKIAAPPAPTPRDLPESHLSRALEKESSCKVPLVGHRVCIRVVDQEQVTVEYKPMMAERFPNSIGAFPYTKKVVLCFMDIEGRPVCFFGMILHEYGSDCPEPNRGRCYLSLLDSVKLPKTMLPSAYRTAIYHAVVRGYLREAGQRGFKACHIYTCPPRKGQNYIFPFKPDDQKEISIIRLRKWYADILSHSQHCEPQAVVGFKNIGDVYPKPDLNEIPYFDGDNWPDILEDILKIDNKIKKMEHDKIENRKLVEKIAASCSRDGAKHPHVKPEPKQGFFAGFPPPKKRRKTETKRPPKPKLTVEGRLHLVMTKSKRDFLVVELVRPEDQKTVLEDPDAKLALATTGQDHTVGTFLRGEKLEFSSLRHAKFSTMLLIHALQSDKLPPERYPDRKEAAAAPAPIGASVAVAEDAEDGGGGAAAAAFDDGDAPVDVSASGEPDGGSGGGGGSRPDADCAAGMELEGEGGGGSSMEGGTAEGSEQLDATVDGDTIADAPADSMDEKPGSAPDGDGAAAPADEGSSAAMVVESA